MLAEDRTTQQIRPRLDASGGRWWLVTGLAGLASVGLGGFGTTVLGFDLMGTRVEEIPLLAGVVGWGPLALAGLVTGVVGGVRRWWLLVPTVVAPLAWLGAVLGEGEVYPAVSGFGYWSLVIGTTAGVTVVASWLIRRFGD